MQRRTNLSEKEWMEERQPRGNLNNACTAIRQDRDLCHHLYLAETCRPILTTVQAWRAGLKHGLFKCLRHSCLLNNFQIPLSPV